MNKVAVRIIGVGLGQLALWGCTKKESPAQPTQEKAPWTIGMSQCNLGEPWLFR